MAARHANRPAADSFGWRYVARIAAALILFCGIIASGVVAGGVSDRLFRSRDSSGAVPDTLLQVTYDQQTQQSHVLAYLPGKKTPAPLLDGAFDPLIAADGAQMVFTQRLPSGDAMQYAVVAFGTGTLARQWRAVIATTPPPKPQSGPDIMLTTEITADRVYVASHNWGSADPATIIALDRTDGAERARWTVDFAGKNVYTISLRALPDGASLAMMGNESNGATTLMAATFVRFRLPDGREIERHTPIEQSNSAPTLGGSLSPDGHTLYQLTYGSSPTSLVLRFFDLENGTVQPALDLPFKTDEQFLTYEQAVSHDGQRLYVLVPGSRALTVVNLATRRIEEQAQLEMQGAKTTGGASLLGRVFATVRGFLVQDVAAKGPLLSGMQFAPDGRTLYAASVQPARPGSIAEPDGIWVIDTQAWRVTQRWLPETAPSTLILSADGRTLTVQDRDGGLRTLDTASGNELARASSGTNGTLISLPDHYRARYGKSPAIGVSTPRLPTPFAALTATVTTDTAVAGDTVTVEARFTNPASGTPITPGAWDVRFTPPAAVMASLTRGGNLAFGQPVTLANAGYGLYRGTVTLAEPGVWAVQARAHWDAGDLPDRQATAARGVTVQPAFVGTDGVRYIARVTTDPARPVVGHPTTLRVAVVDAARGTPLPDGVTIWGGLPPTLDADFIGSAGYRLETLHASGHGIYTSTLPFATAGEWRIAVQVPLPNGIKDAVTVGTVTVGSG